VSFIKERVLEMNIGAKIRELRREKKISQAELARQADLHKNTMSLIERGESTFPHRETLQRIADVLEVPVRALLEPPKSAAEEPPKGSWRMPQFFGDDEKYAAFENYIQSLDLEGLAEYGRALKVEWLAAEKMGDDATAADLEAKRARLTRRMRKLNPPAWTVSIPRGGPIKVTFYREPTETEQAELMRLRESLGYELIEDRELLALAV
jgi:transcriptional regulator with XRE-family HTH domain